MGIFKQIENAYYGILEKLQKSGVPIRAITDPIEKLGIPSWLFLACAFVLFFALVAVIIIPAAANNGVLTISVTSSGQPVPNVKVAAIYGEDQELEAETSESGKVELPLPYGDVQIKLSRSKCSSKKKTIDFAETQELEIAMKCGDITPFAACLETAKNLEHANLASDTGEALSGCTALVSSPSGDANLGWSVSGDGTKMFMPYDEENCPREDQTVSISCNGYAYMGGMKDVLNYAQIGQTIILLSTQPYTPHGNQNDEEEPPIADTVYKAFITVKNENGDALEDVEVSVVKSSGQAITKVYDNTVFESTTASDGVATITLQDGLEFYVKAEDTNALYDTFIGTTKRTANTVLQIEVVLKDGSQTELTVKNAEDNTPLALVSIDIKDSLGTLITTLVTYTDGKAKASLAKKEYTAEITLVGFLPVSESITGGDKKEIRMVPLDENNSATIVVRVLNTEANDNPLTGVLVRLVTESDMKVSECTTDTNGTCTMTLIPPGSYRLVTDSGTNVDEAPQHTELFDAGAGEVVEKILGIVPPKFTLTVNTMIDGDKVDGVTVEIYDATYDKYEPDLVDTIVSGPERNVKIGLAYNSEVYLKAWAEKRGEFFGPVITEYITVDKNMEYDVDLKAVERNVSIDIVDGNGMIVDRVEEGKEYTARISVDLPWFDPHTEEAFAETELHFWLGEPGDISDPEKTPIVIGEVQANDFAQTQYPKITAIELSGYFSYVEGIVPEEEPIESKYFGLYIGEYKEAAVYQINLPIRVRSGFTGTSTNLHYLGRWITEESELFETNDGDWTDVPVPIDAPSPRDWKTLDCGEDMHFALYDAWLSSDLEGENKLESPTVPDKGTVYLQVDAVSCVETNTYEIPVKTLPDYVVPNSYSFTIRRTGGQETPRAEYTGEVSYDGDSFLIKPAIDMQQTDIYKLNADDVLSIAIVMKADLLGKLGVLDEQTVTTYVMNDFANQELTYKVKKGGEDQTTPIPGVVAAMYTASEVNNGGYAYDYLTETVPSFSVYEKSQEGRLFSAVVALKNEDEVSKEGNYALADEHPTPWAKFYSQTYPVVIESVEDGLVKGKTLDAAKTWVEFGGEGIPIKFSGNEFEAVMPGAGDYELSAYVLMQGEVYEDSASGTEDTEFTGSTDGYTAKNAADFGVGEFTPVNIRGMLGMMLYEEAAKALVQVPRSAEPTETEYKQEGIEIPASGEGFATVVGKGIYVSGDNNILKQESTAVASLWEGTKKAWESGNFKHGWVDFDLKLVGVDDGNQDAPLDMDAKKLRLYVEKITDFPPEVPEYLGKNWVDIATVQSPDNAIYGIKSMTIDLAACAQDKCYFETGLLTETLGGGTLTVKVDSPKFGKMEKDFTTGGVRLDGHIIGWDVSSSNVNDEFKIVNDQVSDTLTLTALSFAPAETKNAFGVSWTALGVYDKNDVKVSTGNGILDSAIPALGYAKLRVTTSTKPSPCNPGAGHLTIENDIADVNAYYNFRCAPGASEGNVVTRETMAPSAIWSGTDAACVTSSGTSKICDAEQFSAAVLRDLKSMDTKSYGIYALGNEVVTSSILDTTLSVAGDRDRFEGVYTEATDTGGEQVFVEGTAGCGIVTAYFEEVVGAIGEDKRIVFETDSTQDWCDETRGEYAMGALNFDQDLRPTAGKFAAFENDIDLFYSALGTPEEVFSYNTNVVATSTTGASYVFSYEEEELGGTCTPTKGIYSVDGTDFSVSLATSLPAFTQDDMNILRSRLAACLRNFWAMGSGCSIGFIGLPDGSKIAEFPINDDGMSRGVAEQCYDDTDNDCDGVVDEDCYNCDNFVKDYDEEDIDCGGYYCIACPACDGVACETGENCLSCPGDCGLCPIDHVCTANEQCESGNCDSGQCKPFCGDGTCDIDFGESCKTCVADCGKCTNGEQCAYDSQCDSGLCVHEVCRSTRPFCGDTYCDVGETEVNCIEDCYVPVEFFYELESFTGWQCSNNDLNCNDWSRSYRNDREYSGDAAAISEDQGSGESVEKEVDIPAGTYYVSLRVRPYSSSQDTNEIKMSFYRIEGTDKHGDPIYKVEKAKVFDWDGMSTQNRVTYWLPEKQLSFSNLIQLIKMKEKDTEQDWSVVDAIHISENPMPSHCKDATLNSGEVETDCGGSCPGDC